MKKSVVALSAAVALSATFASNAMANTYTVKSGDTLSKIAKQHKTTVANIKQLNRLSSDQIHINQKLIISITQAAKQEAKTTAVYTVVAGDSLSKIANKFNMSVAELKSLNKLNTDTIYKDQRLTVKKIAGSQPSAPVPVQPPAPASDEMYAALPGDSLWKIANKFGISIQELKSANQLKSDSVYVGQRLAIPRSAASIPDSPSPGESVKADTPPPVQNDNLIELAKSLIGVSYAWGGTTPKGFDCSGYIYYVLNNSGKQISRTSASGYFAKGATVANPKAGDLVFFSSSPSNKKMITHMGIYLGNGEFIHASSSKGVRIDTLGLSYYQTRLAGFKSL
ncbi:LysM peptidoglycan-binding domain-containing protein [Peribacillus sp. SCS-155]|uniref:C40 family peptidase n=1 Tax=Peribacillus sedimenti TaxID=3115297 RepID=UPI003905DA1D